MSKLNLTLSIFILFFSCKNDSKTSSTPSEENAVDIPSDFLDFYTKFHSDSLFQMNHIVFPLSQKSDGSKWQRDSWKLHKAFDSQNGAFIRSFDNFNGIIFEYIVEKTGAYKIEKRYSKSGDSYNLIYYTSQIRMEGWDSVTN